MFHDSSEMLLLGPLEENLTFSMPPARLKENAVGFCIVS